MAENDTQHSFSGRVLQIMESSSVHQGKIHNIGMVCLLIWSSYRVVFHLLLRGNFSGLIGV